MTQADLNYANKLAEGMEECQNALTLAFEPNAEVRIRINFRTPYREEDFREIRVSGINWLQIVRDTLTAHDKQLSEKFEEFLKPSSYEAEPPY